MELVNSMIGMAVNGRMWYNVNVDALRPKTKYNNKQKKKKIDRQVNR